MTSEPKPPFEQVYLNYASKLEIGSGKLAFIKDIQLKCCEVPVQDIQNEIQNLATKCSDRKFRRLMEKFFMPVVQSLEEYCTASDQMGIASSALVALVWGGLKTTTEALIQFPGTLESIQSVLDNLSDHLWELKDCSPLYSKSRHCPETVQSIIHRSYTHITDLWYRLTKEITRSLIEQSFGALRKNHKLDKALEAIGADAEILTRICQIAQSQLQSDTQEPIATNPEEIMAERERQIVERIAAAEERQLNQRMQLAMRKAGLAQTQQDSAVKAGNVYTQTSVSGNAFAHFGDVYQYSNGHQQLIETISGDHSYGTDLYHAMRDRHPGTCEWVFETKAWRDWIATEIPTTVLWVHGKHGCGKSYICAAAIEKVRIIDNSCIAFHFITRGREVSWLQLLRSLAYQLVKCVEIRSGDITKDLASLIKSCSIHSDQFERLIGSVLSELDQVFIFLDGLDEATNIDDMKRLIKFLSDKAIEHRGRVRVWFSSQPLPSLSSAIKAEGRDQVFELAVQVSDTEKDIARFLDLELSESTKNASSLAQLFVKSSVNTEAQGSFLWAVKMVEELKDQVENSEDMIRLAERGLPTSMHDIYKNIVASYKQKRSRNGEMPLWRIILSILTFTRRPLHISELRQAISIVKGKSIELMRDEQIIGECPGLVRHIKSQSGADDGTLVLSHGSVHQFLKEHASNAATHICTLLDCTEHEIVESDLLAICCVKYLLQNCYSLPLKNQTRAHFKCCDGSLLKEHHLALYAAKYWYRHCNESTASKEIQVLVKQFLLSENFRTCLQIQSVSIIGHFLISYHQLTGDPKCMKQNLPSWIDLINDDANKFQSQYKVLLREWNHVLQVGLSSQFIGEIDRVLWPSLGPKNFLNKGQSRYKSFLIGQAPLDSASATSTLSCQVWTSSTDGMTQTVCHLYDSSQEAAVITVESWKLDGIRESERIAQSTWQIQKEDALWSLFSTPCTQRLSLIPRATQGRLNNTAKLGSEGNVMHVGALLFLRSKATDEFTYQQFNMDCSEAADTYFEESCKKGTVFALSRRRQLKKFKDSHVEKEEERTQRMKTLYDRQARKWDESAQETQRDRDYFASWRRRHRRGRQSTSDLHSQDDDVPSSDSGDEELVEDEIGRGSGSDSVIDDAGAGSASGDMESIPEDQSSSPEMSSCGSFDSPDESQSETDDEPQNDFDVASQSDRDSEELKSLLSDSDDDMINADSDHESVENEEAMKELGCDSDEEFRYPVGITSTLNFPTWCSVCGTWLRSQCRRCVACESGSFVLCNECFQKGCWCYDLKHPIYEVAKNGLQSISSWNNYLVRQTIRIFETASNPIQQLFSWKGEVKNDMLHESPPCFHPRLPLVVWPTGQEKLLFANYVDGLKRTCSLRTTERKATQLSMNLHFSENGELLYVATVEAVRLLDKKKSSPASAPKVYELTFVLTTLQISSENPVDERPTVLSQQLHSIGPWKKPYSSVIPYCWTWTKTEAYFSINGLTLQLYKISLAMPENVTANRGPITTPSETVFLPHSAQNRSVQYFPPRKPGAASTVIIGPHYGSEQSPPIGIYLQESDLGEWIDVQEKTDVSVLQRLKRRMTGKFEEFDTDDDCDIIPWEGN